MRPKVTSKTIAHRVEYPAVPFLGYPGDDMVLSGPWASTKLRGLKTNLAKPAYPRVFRRFGRNTRATVYPLPKTGILDNIYDKGFFNTSEGPTSLIPNEHNALLGQGGATQDVLSAVPSLASGAHHWLFTERS